MLCLYLGSTFGVPLALRCGLITDLGFLIMGYVSFPRAFFGDMRPRKAYKRWLFESYLS